MLHVVPGASGDEVTPGAPIRQIAAAICSPVVDGRLATRRTQSMRRGAEFLPMASSCNRGYFLATRCLKKSSSFRDTALRASIMPT